MSPHSACSTLIPSYVRAGSFPTPPDLLFSAALTHTLLLLGKCFPCLLFILIPCVRRCPKAFNDPWRKPLLALWVRSSMGCNCEFTWSGRDAATPAHPRTQLSSQHSRDAGHIDAHMCAAQQDRSKSQTHVLNLFSILTHLTLPLFAFAKMFLMTWILLVDSFLSLSPSIIYWLIFLPSSLFLKHFYSFLV